MGIDPLFLKGKHVLLVEEDPLTRKGILKILSPIQAFLDTVETGAEALRFVRLKEHEILLLNYRLKELDGFEIARSVREKEKKMKRKRIPILAITPVATDEDRKKGMVAGIDEFILDPLSEGVLLERMIFWLTP